MSEPMNTCSTCKWWIPPGFIHAMDTGASDTLGVCQLTVLVMQRPLHPESLARATERDGWEAMLNTSSAFGCNQWTKDGD